MNETRGKGTLKPETAYRADAGHVQTVRWLAVVLGLVVLFSAAPALRHVNPATAPDWARVVLLVATLQAVYLVWMAATPDWSTVWVAMLVFAAVATLYAVATAMVLATPLDSPMPLGMGELRTRLGRWCGAVLMLMSLATYLCGRTSAKWHGLIQRQAAHRRKKSSGTRTSGNDP